MVCTFVLRPKTYHVPPSIALPENYGMVNSKRDYSWLRGGHLETYAGQFMKPSLGEPYVERKEAIDDRLISRKAVEPIVNEERAAFEKAFKLASPKGDWRYDKWVYSDRLTQVRWQGWSRAKGLEIY